MLAAVGAVRSSLKIDWKTASPPDASDKKGKVSATDFAQSIASVASAKDKPLLIFVESHEMSNPEDKRRRRPTRQASESDNVISRSMEGKENRNFMVAALAQHFVCARVDVTKVTKKQLRDYCSEKAPQVILVSAEGEVVKKLKGLKSCTGRALATAMVKTLKKSGCSGISGCKGKLEDLLTDLYAIEYKIAKDKGQVSSAEKSLESAKKKKAGKSTLTKMEERVKSLQEGIKTMEEKRNKIRDDLNGLLKDLSSAA